MAIVWAILGTVAVVFLLRCLYNLYLHPLSKFPGPKLAAIGSFYEFYYDVIKDGTFLWKTEEMHRKYGPIIRVNANELHIRDPQYYSTIYAGSGRRVNKYPDAVAAYTVPRASLATVEHDIHRIRRGILSPYFSERSVVKLEPTMYERVGRLCERLEDARCRGEVIDLDAAFAALTADIITSYFYGWHYDYLGNKDFKFAIRDAIIGLVGFYHVTRFLPALANFIKKLPIPIVRCIQPGAADLLLSEIQIKREILKALEDDARNGKETDTRSIVMGAIKNPDLPAQEKTIDRLVDEGTTIVFGGTETTARSLSVAMFHLLNDKSVLQKLRDELETLPPVEGHAYPYAQLKALPYLTGAVNEGIRLAHGPSVRLPRVAVQETLHYKNWAIPPGTPVSQSTPLVHLDPSIFPKPHSFDPERWVKAARDGFQLDRYLVSFTKGTRQCVGINLAYAELYITLAKLVRSFDMELFETTSEDLEIYHIRLTPYPRKGQGEVKVRVTEKCI
ncbi:hypothetical protein Egran_05126 [Elaphomyces granulatus]|uniref:Trichodiene oxygenase n=1 Tax=Elaphomyces granulatus TaxID=519963 RepID=A0A232LSK4_9EURO|nr:hypothetical protein Egran_05126 [Elaphomyces granulatus]